MARLLRVPVLAQEILVWQALVAAAKEAYDSNLETYRQGLSTIVELLTAERDLAGARYTLIQSRADLLTSNAAVTYAAGAIGTP